MNTNRRYRFIIAALLIGLMTTFGFNGEAEAEIELYKPDFAEIMTKAITDALIQMEKEEQERLRQEELLLAEKEQDKTIINYTESEYNLFCRLVMGEAGGESYDCQLATATVVVNRVLSGRFPNSLKGVIRQRGQFSARTDRKPTESVKKACWEAVCGRGNIPSDILYFRASRSKKWGSQKFYKRIGGHSFYKQ